MKARDQNYSQEAAALLRDISMYRALTREQVLRLYPGKRDKINELLIYLTKQQRLLYEEGLYRAAPGHDGKVDKALFAAVWVLVDFIDRVEYHAIGEFPAKVIFIADGQIYEIVHMEPGKEAMLSQVMGRHEEDPPHYLVLVDDPEQINGLELPNVCGYCTVSPGGMSNTIKKNRGKILNRAILSQRISSILDDIHRLNNALYAMNTTDIQRYPDNYETLSTDAALRAEQIACRLRHILYATTNVQKGDYLTSAALMMGIDIQYTDGIMEITLPSLLPKRKRRPSSEFLLDPFHAALSQYAREHPMPQFKHCVVCFSNIYNRELPERRVRDYDNLELKRLLDVAASFMLVDDSGLLCDAYHTTELGEADCTRISIMDSGRFADWLKGREKVLDSITDL